MAIFRQLASAGKREYLRFTRTETDADGNDVDREIPFLKAYTVFNVAQIEGLPAHYYAEPEATGEKLELIETAEQLFAATGAVIRHGGDKAYYAPGPDVIQLPVPEAFRSAESYAATKAHELTHWAKHPSRLDRDFGGKRFGDTGYAREELVAESPPAGSRSGSPPNEADRNVEPSLR